MANLEGVYAHTGGTRDTARLARDGSLLVSPYQAKFQELTHRKSVHSAYAGPVTAPVIYSTAAGTGGPLLWNGTADVDAVILAVGFGTSVVTTVAGSLGLTGATGQPVAPTSTTAIDAQGEGYIGGPVAGCTPYRIGTPLNAGQFFFPFAQVHTGALTVDTTGVQWIDLGGCVIVPPQCWVSVAASATLTTLVAQIGMIWAEVRHL